jgi:hypothetical protein
LEIKDQNYDNQTKVLKTLLQLSAQVDDTKAKVQDIIKNKEKNKIIMSPFENCFLPNELLPSL